MFEFDIINHVMDNSDKKELASLIQASQRMHEESFDIKQHTHTLSITRCVNECFNDLDLTIDKFWISVCENLITCQWNECIDFVNKILGE